MMVTQPATPQQWEEVDRTIQSLFAERCEALARTTQFVQRKRELTGKIFAQTLVFGWMANPNASYTTLQQTMALQGCHLSAQALEKRMGAQAAEYLHALLGELLGTCVEHEGVMTEVLERFEGVYVQDGTIVSLPDELKEQYQGCGGTSEYAGAESALRIQVRLNLTTGGLQGPWLQGGREEENQGEGSMQETRLPAGALYLTDSKYVTMKTMKEHEKQESFFLTHARADLQLTDERGVKYGFPTFLRSREKQGPIDEWVTIGGRNPCRVRVVAFAVSEQTATRLRTQAHKRSKMRPKGSRRDVRVGKKHARPSREGQHKRKMSQARFALAGWTILLTNVPKERLAAHEVRVLARARWQIELLWRAWKEHGKIDLWRSEKPMRILCEVYAKLMGCIIQHWIVLKGCWQHPHRSLVKARQAVEMMALAYLLSLSGPITSQRVLEVMGQMLQRSRLNHHSTRWSTADLLQEPCRALA